MERGGAGATRKQSEDGLAQQGGAHGAEFGEQGLGGAGRIERVGGLRGGGGFEGEIGRECAREDLGGRGVGDEIAGSAERDLVFDGAPVDERE